jgi:hypothetical protein
MKNETFRYLISLVILLLVLLSTAPACSLLQPAPLTELPKPPVVQKPSQPTSDNQSTMIADKPPENTSSSEETWYHVATFDGIISETNPAFYIYGSTWHLTWAIQAQNLDTAVFKLAIYTEEQPFAMLQTVSNDGGTSGTVNFSVSSIDKRNLFVKVTALNIQHWTIDIEDNATAATYYSVEISSIHFKGTIYPVDPSAGCCTYERIEPDEYVVIKNLGLGSQDMTGWLLKNISKPTPVFKFPNFVIGPGEIIRVYTDEYHPETGALTFYYGYGDIWSNDHADIAVLYDAFGNEVSRKSYAPPMELNEKAE